MAVFTWLDTPGDDPEAVQLALPLLGGRELGERFLCPLPDHAGHEAYVSPMDLSFNCEFRRDAGMRPCRLVDVYAALRHAAVGLVDTNDTNIVRLSPPAAAAWWGHLWTEAGVLTFDVPDVVAGVDWAGPNRRANAETVLAGLVRLQAVHAAGGIRTALPVNLSRHFAAAWCGVHPMIARRALLDLYQWGAVTRHKVKPERGRAVWRYDLTGRNLRADRAEQAAILTAIVPTSIPKAA